MIYARAALGIAFFCFVAWLLSTNRRKLPWRVVVFGVVMQAGLGWFILGTSTGLRCFEWLGDKATKLISMTDAGSQLVFGVLAKPDVLGAAVGAADGFVFAFKALTVIIFFSALMALLYHLGIMQILVWVLAKIMSALLGVSGAESMAMAANVFVGQTEAPLVVRPYIPRMTMSELNALMTGGFATIAGSMLAVYIGLLGPEYASHLLTASVMSAPAAFMIAKVMRPEVELSETSGVVELRIERTAGNVIEAVANGTSDGLKLWLNVCAMLLAFVALIALIDWPLGYVGEVLALEGGLSLSRLFGWVFAPVAWLIGVEGWHDCQVFGSLLGTKVAVNEFVAFAQLASMLPGAEGDVVFASKRSAAMAAYALCGFANFSSIGIQLGGIGPLAPERRADLSRLALKAMFGGAMASFTTAAVAGVFLS
jgi:CNT family concentrative nucleoside transporter